MRTFIDRFSSLDDVPNKQRGDPIVVLQALSVAGRFSCFEVDSKLAGSFESIKRHGWAEFDTSVGYPWTRVTITEAGRAEIESAA
jgi:hypothetical protein